MYPVLWGALALTEVQPLLTVAIATFQRLRWIQWVGCSSSDLLPCMHCLLTWTHVCTGKPPLYFQHQGHSRTIVGIERESSAHAEAFTLLVLDPSVPHARLSTALQSNSGWQVVAPGHG